MSKTSRAASRQPMAEPIPIERIRDIVFIEGLMLQTIIGIDAGEPDEAQPVIVDLELSIDHLNAGRTDRIADAIDYGAVRRRLIDLAATHEVKLLEAFAELIAETTLREFGAVRARIRVAKPHKFADVAAFGVTIERRRACQLERRSLDVV